MLEFFDVAQIGVFIVRTAWSEPATLEVHPVTTFPNANFLSQKVYAHWSTCVHKRVAYAEREVYVSFIRFVTATVSHQLELECPKTIRIS